MDHAADTAEWRIAEVFVFDTCTYKCAYCHFAEYGKVLDASQLKPYRDPEFIRLIAGFFNRRATGSWRWLLQFTGGEPLLMPNFALLSDLLAECGNKIALYTALMIGRDHPSFRYLIEKAAIRWLERLMLLGVRDLLIKQRTMVINAIRGHAAEFGVIAARGR